MDRTIELKEHGVSFSLPDIINTRDMLRFQAAWAQSAAGPHKEYVFVFQSTRPHGARRRCGMSTNAG